jgi:nitrate/TMAO reductase-like tetraheme cytochrome c subunit
MIGLLRTLQVPDGFHPGMPLDTTVVTSPVPAIQPLFNFLLNLRNELQIAGFLVGLVLAVAAGAFVWRRRAALRHWLVTRSRGARIALASAVAAVILTVAAAGGWTYNYVEHENAFCSSCHIMNDAYMRFAGSEHAQLGCHDCHRQSIITSMRQLVLWVAERPEEIPPHAPVPTAICGECHLQWRPDPQWMTDSAWLNVRMTAGHIIHLDSDAPALAGMQCADCHGQRVHSFIPVETTCLSSGCHLDLDIQLGRMASAPTAFHCAGCHEFTAQVGAHPELDGRTAERVISPTLEQCYGCHEMERLLPRAEMAREPHEAACGLCHNPHTQVQVSEAVSSCTAAGCHDQVSELTPFHRGLHESVTGDCLRCHLAHDFRVDGNDCIACHRDIYDEPRVGLGGAAGALAARGHPPLTGHPPPARYPPLAGGAPVAGGTSASLFVHGRER